MQKRTVEGKEEREEAAGRVREGGRRKAAVQDLNKKRNGEEKHRCKITAAVGEEAKSRTQSARVGATMSAVQSIEVSFGRSTAHSPSDDG
eukprot:2369108-Rhodomonas_salina.3